MLLHIRTFRQPKITVVCHFSKKFWLKKTVVFNSISNANILHFAFLEGYPHSPYSDFLCSGFPVHCIFVNKKVLDFQYIYFNLIALHLKFNTFSIYTHFVYRIYGTFENWQKFCAVCTVHFNPISNANILWFSKYIVPLIDTFRVLDFQYIWKLTKISFWIFSTF